MAAKAGGRGAKGAAGRGAKAAPGAGRAAKAEKKSQADLDADLDSYMALAPPDAAAPDAAPPAAMTA